MAFATLIFWMGRKQFAHIPPEGRNYFKHFTEKKVSFITCGDISDIFFCGLFWALFDQIGTLWQIQCRELDRLIPQWVPLWGGYELLPAQVSAVFLIPVHSSSCSCLLEVHLSFS